ncbi:hypothetical protein AVEN_232497-1 [Araneus ventricosus]|uniref:Uncharacterized protein n=1 Tax=Araneus ventricosus TaxID=182803 RepID=A0A4Y1ZVL7_ARAVE|nr:hypothetical protein AVEN_232497-1 [Araneus ventricosus]
MCLHEKDFKLKAQWSFFATSHGKTECDGIGGTAKRLARKQSLQQHLDRQITTTNELFELHCNIVESTLQTLPSSIFLKKRLILLALLWKVALKIHKLFQEPDYSTTFSQ